MYWRCLIRAQLEKAVDEVAQIFIRSVRNMNTAALERLKRYQLEHVEQGGEHLVSEFRNVLTAFEDEDTSDPQKVARIRKMLDGEPAAWIERCNEHIACAGKRALLAYIKVVADILDEARERPWQPEGRHRHPSTAASQPVVLTQPCYQP